VQYFAFLIIKTINMGLKIKEASKVSKWSIV